MRDPKASGLPPSPTGQNSSSNAQSGDLLESSPRVVRSAHEGLGLTSHTLGPEVTKASTEIHAWNPWLTSTSQLSSAQEKTCPIIGTAHIHSHTSRRGGARNRKGRITSGLSEAQVRRVQEAISRAIELGLPLNRFITIHWQAQGVPLELMPWATTQYFDRLSKFLRRNGCKAAYVYVHENGPQKGHHTHILAHVPSGLIRRLTRLQRRWLEAISSQSYVTRAIKSKPVGYRQNLAVTSPKLYALHLDIVEGYVLKGATENAAIECLITRLEAGGLVAGKRCGTSQSLSN